MPQQNVATRDNIRINLTSPIKLTLKILTGVIYRNPF